MTAASFLEDFSQTSAPETILSDEAMEESRLQYFENGYQAGWEDAAKAHATEQGAISAELARNLQDMSFSYHEAEAAILGSLRPLFSAIAAKLLPQVALEALGPHIVAELDTLVREIGGATCVITVAPDMVDRVRALLASDGRFAVSIQEDETLGAGQAYLRLGARERSIDLDQAIADISAAIESHFNHQQEDQQHG